MNQTANASTSPTSSAVKAPSTGLAKTQGSARTKAVAPSKSTVAKKTTLKATVKSSVAQTAATPHPKKSTQPSIQKGAATPVKALKDKKVKVVRDSFTIPKTELMQIGEMKKRALGLGVGVKKSELIRAGLSALTSMTDASFKKALASVPTIKTGRPAKD